MGDDVEQLAAGAHEIMHDVSARSHPQHDVGGVDLVRHSLGRRHAAKTDAAGEARRISAEQALAHLGMNAVGADHEVRFDLAAIGKTRNGAVCARCDRYAAQPKPDVGRPQRARQNLEQIGAINRNARRAEFLAIVALIAARDFASGAATSE